MIAEPTETERRNLTAVTEVLPYWNAHDIAGVLSFYDDNITWINIALEETYIGKEQVRAFLAQLFSAFPDLNFEVTYKIARTDNVAEQWVIRGTHRGTFIGVPATGRRVTIPGMSMVELRDGKFLSDHFYFDSGIALRQMGLLPPLATTRGPVGQLVLRLVVGAARGVRAAAGVMTGRRRRTH